MDAKTTDEEWDNVRMSSDGTIFIGADEIFYSPDNACLHPKNALKLLKWLEEHREELEKFAKIDPL